MRKKLNPCPVCQREDPVRPMCFQGEPWCSDDCRKVVQGLSEPTKKQLNTMNMSLMKELGINIIRGCSCPQHGIDPECNYHDFKRRSE